MKNNKHYAAMGEFYGDQRAARCGVLLMARIDEGLALIDAIEAAAPSQPTHHIHIVPACARTMCSALRY